MGVRRFEDYLAEFKTQGPVWFAAKYRVPLLVRCDGFDERVAGKSTSQSRALAGRGSTMDGGPLALTFSEVFLVAKREGSPFQNRIGVGRSPTIDIPMALRRLSKYHAYFSTQPSGEHTLTDARSKNGTWVDEVRLKPLDPVAIGDSSLIRFGPYRFLFCAPGSFRLLVEKGREAIASSPSKASRGSERQ